jgi:hypothetical protein
MPRLSSPWKTGVSGHNALPWRAKAGPVAVDRQLIAAEGELQLPRRVLRDQVEARLMARGCVDVRLRVRSLRCVVGPVLD